MPPTPYDHPELIFLAHCTHRQVEPERILQLMATGINVDAVYRLARQHGLAMILYRGLLQVGQPQTLIDRLKAEMTQRAIQYEFVYPQQLAAILDALHEREIETLVLKGHALGQRVYQQPVLRPYDDFDILVPPGKLQAAAGAIATLGYYPDEDVPDYHVERHHLVPHLHPEWLPVELHWRLVTPLGTTHIDMDAIWAESAHWAINGTTTRTLSTEHQVIYLSLHAVSGHLFNMGLKSLCDIQEVVNNQPVDWDQVVAACHDWQCARQVYLALQVVNTFYGPVVPDDILQRVSPQAIDDELLAYSAHNVMATAIAGLEDSSGLAQVWQEDDLPHVMGLTLRRLFPSPITIGETYGVNGWRRWLLYPRWQTALLKRHLVTGLHLLRADPATIENVRHEVVRRALIDWVSGG